MQSQFRYNPTTGQVEEAVFQSVGDDFQTNVDNAQNSVNACTEAVATAEASYAAAEQAAASASDAFEDAKQSLEAAEEQLTFQTDRKAAYDEAVRLGTTMAESTPETEFAEDVDESTDEDTDSGESEAVEVPITVV